MMHTLHVHGHIAHLLWQLYHSIGALSVDLQPMRMVWPENWHIRWLNATERHQMNFIYRHRTMYERLVYAVPALARLHGRSE